MQSLHANRANSMSVQEQISVGILIAAAEIYMVGSIRSGVLRVSIAPTRIACDEWPINDRPTHLR